MPDQHEIYGDVSANEDSDVDWGSYYLDDGVPSHKHDSEGAITLSQIRPYENHGYARSNAQEYESGPQESRRFRSD